MSAENEKLNQLEKEFNYFLMMDQQENLETEIERKKIPQVGRNLESMFKQEVPTQHIFDSRTKATSIMNNEFSKKSLSSTLFQNNRMNNLGSMNRNMNGEQTAQQLQSAPSPDKKIIPPANQKKITEFTQGIDMEFINKN